MAESVYKVIELIGTQRGVLGESGQRCRDTSGPFAA
jgi:flavin-binding protein dodecin